MYEMHLSALLPGTNISLTSIAGDKEFYSQIKKETMRNIIEKMLDSYEKGGVSRRDFVQSLAVIIAAPTTLSQAGEAPLTGKMLNHVTLYVSDVARSKKFYQSLLALPIRKEEKSLCNFDLGQSFLCLYQKEGSAPAINHFCMGVNSFHADTVLEKLKKEFPSSNPTMENGTEIYLRDPDNIRVQLSAKDYKG